MSKMEGLRAMREARYQEAASRATGPRVISAPGGQRARPPADAQPPVAEAGDPAAAACGHRSISGRTCTRELGHTSKSHRYS